LNDEVIRRIDAYIEEITGNGNIRCLIFHSKKNFAAGADIISMVDCNEEEARAFSASPTFSKIEQLSIPTIAAIEGYALGGGLELALACDLRIAADSAKMGFPEITLGIMPGAGGTIRAPRIIGEAFAKELIFTGKIISAERAAAMGLVNRVAPEEETLSEALKIAEKIARSAPYAMTVAKKTIRAGAEEPDYEKGLRLELDNWVKLFNTEDQKEGMRAFMEKRKPEFKNR
ncbi:MAG TPA: enoyl-CoA hydratase-related protein, partial [Anaerovoracaceae bacterium]|nr:enoyl-CoA hydratase-related protein [Anaerovoracaceae bacterium]